MNTIVAIPFDDELAGFIGKKGSENSMTFYNRKINDDVIVGMMPSSIEEKFYALPQSLLIADQIAVSTKSIDKLFGEVLVACSLLGKKTIFTKDNDITKILSGITIEKISFVESGEIVSAIISSEQEPQSDETRVDLDRAFNVKGVGTVFLGVVTKGTVKVHDTLYHNSGKVATIRSIQSQDQDVKEASKGTRVGLAIKGIDEADVQKGDVLSKRQIKSAKTLELEVKKSGFVSEPIEVGKMYSIAIGFSYSVATVEKVEGNAIVVRLEKSIPVEEKDQFMLVRALSPRIFASGSVTKAD
ncbi:MAG: EF-Tu/IF-2/RF-3 family GTPase [Candidatus Micrarchaeaceae archaeon]